MHATPTATPVLRVTPLMVLSDIRPSMIRYQDLGFERVDSGHDGCMGMRAGDTSVILASDAFMSSDFDADHIARLVGHTIKYIHVTSVEHAKRRLSANAHILQEVRTRGGTREALVNDDGDVLILAERLA
jgi:ethanolamine utilization microcompartment shell protein EutS